MDNRESWVYVLPCGSAVVIKATVENMRRIVGSGLGTEWVSCHSLGAGATIRIDAKAERGTLDVSPAHTVEVCGFSDDPDCPRVV